MFGDNQGWGRGYQPRNSIHHVPSYVPQDRGMARARHFFAVAIGAFLLVAAAKLSLAYGLLVPADAVRPFPASGDVVIGQLDRSRTMSLLTLQSPVGSEDNYVARLADPGSGSPIMTIFLRPHSQVSLPVPVGRYILKLAHGLEWRGMKSLFGQSTKIESASDPLVITADGPGMIEIGGNLSTRRASAF